MNLVNTYLLLPLQRKIFKNFGHYDYQTNTFHLNEERVNEVFFDPAYNPFVDVLRETAHASAVASSKAAAAHETASGSGGTSSPAPQPSLSAQPGAAQSGTAGGGTSKTGERSRPPVRLLSGKVRSPGLLSFLHRITTQKSLTVESIDLVVEVAAPPLPTAEGDAEHSSDGVVNEGHRGTEENAGDEAGALPSDAATGTDEDGTRFLSSSARLAHSYSIEDHTLLLARDAAEEPDSDDAAEPGGGGSPSPGSPTRGGGGGPSPSSGAPPRRFHTVGDLMTYLKQQLQGVTVGVEDLRLTVCVPPAGASGSAVGRRSRAPSATAPGRTAAATAATDPVQLRKGTRVVHLSCRRGLRFTVDEAAATAAPEDMQCTAAVEDWQCYLHVMARDGRVPTTFVLDDLIFATSTTHAAQSPLAPVMRASGAAAAGVGCGSTPFTVRVARRGGGVLVADPAPPRVLVEVEAAGGWSAVLSAAQVAHLVGMLEQVTDGRRGEADGAAAPAAASSAAEAAASPTTPRTDASESATAALQRRVVEAPVESGEAVTAAALAASQLRTVAKYVSVHCGGFSITLLTQAVVGAGVVAQAWRRALSAEQLLLLDEAGQESRTEPAAPVYEALATAHLTYAMRDVDVLFPSIDASAPPPSTSPLPASAAATPVASGVFQQSARKRKVYRKIFDNQLADPAVTAKLEQSRGEAASVFVGVGAISFLEYRHAVHTAATEDTASPASPTPSRHLWRDCGLRPARLMHAVRGPYALVLFHRTTPPLLEVPPSSGLGLSASASLAHATQPCLRSHQETIVVGVASIVVQLDPGLLEALVAYGATVTEQLRHVGDCAARADVEGAASPASAAVSARAEGVRTPPPTSPLLPSAAPSPQVRTRSSVKVFLESIDASVRFPVLTEGQGAALGSLSDGTAASAGESALLSRLLQCLRETSQHAHAHNRRFLRRRARQTQGGADSTDVAAGLLALCAVQEQLGFPEDATRRARFLPELLRFSLRDLQVVHTPSAARARTGSDGREAATAASQQNVVYVPASTSVKWREAVVYVQDILEDTKSELLRVNYSPEMHIHVTHTGLSAGHRGACAALQRVLALHVRLGEITTTALTQDDYLLATYYVNELMETLSRCRQRLHTTDTTAAAAAAAPERPAGSRRSSARVDPATARRATSPAASPPSPPALDGRERLPESAVAEAFAVADAHDSARGAAAGACGPGGRARRGGRGRASGSRGSSTAAAAAGSAPSSSSSFFQLTVPALWRCIDTTCTSADIRIGRIRLGLLAPRLSPMGHVVGEPLFRCLPKAQRRCLVDLNCLYHLYVMELLEVSVHGLTANGALAGAGQATYARVRVGGFSLWERRPAPAPPRALAARDDGRLSGVMASSLYNSSASGAPGSGAPAAYASASEAAGARRELAYYLATAATAAHSSHHRGGETLVQLVQSFTEADQSSSGSSATDADGDEGDEATLDRDVATGTKVEFEDRSDARRSARVLAALWDAYVHEMEDVHDAPPATSHGRGVCEVRLLEAAEPAVTSPLAPPSPTGSNTRHVSMQLTGLGLHHAVAYNGDHLAAVLKQFFTGADGSMAAAPATPPPVPIPGARGGSTARADTDEGAAAAAAGSWYTEVRVDMVNLMATYRPHGAGRALAVLLLPRASLFLEAPVSAAASPPPASTEPRAARRSAATTYRPSPPPPALPQTSTAAATASPTAVAADTPVMEVRARAWLHTPLPLYVCNDCEVEALMGEVLDPAESDDWGVDLESAGFVRLCEVVSTAASPAGTASGFTPRRHGTVADPTSTGAGLPLPTPNLLVTVHASAAAADASAASGGDGEDGATRAPTVSVQLQHVELSAFMARDSFEVFRDLAEAWGSGADLQTTDAPAALVMRSGPGFEWVAEEVARSCAPMTFRVNPYLAPDEVPAQEAAEDSAPQHRARSALRHIASVEDHTSHYPFAPSSATLMGSRTFEAPWGTAPAAHRGGGGSGHAYDYQHWLDALHASRGRDSRLHDTYQTRVAQLLDGAPWVPAAERPGPASVLARDGAGGAAGHTAAAARPGARVSPMLPPPPQQQAQRTFADAMDTISVPSDDEDDAVGVNAHSAAAPSHQLRPTRSPQRLHGRGRAVRGVTKSRSPAGRRSRSRGRANIASLSSSFSDMEDFEAAKAPLEWCVMPTSNAGDEDSAGCSPSLLSSSDAKTRDADRCSGGDSGVRGGVVDLFAACESQQHFLSFWSRERVEAARQRRAARLHQLDRTDDVLLHDTAEKYLYPPAEVEFFLSDCALNVSLYEGTDLMAAAVRQQRRGYLQIVSRGASMAQAASVAVPRASSTHSASMDTAAPSVAAETAVPAFSDAAQLRESRTQRSLSRCSRATATTSVAALAGGESSASRLRRLDERGSRSGFGDRDASKRLVLSCRGITVQADTFPQAAEEDLWFRVVVGEVTVFDCIDVSDVHRLLTATPRPSSTAGGSSTSPASASAVPAGGGAGDSSQLELTGLLTSSKSVHVTTGGMLAAEAAQAVSQFQQGGSELSLVVRLQPTSLTWSGASVDFAMSFFASAATAAPSVSTTVGGSGGGSGSGSSSTANAAASAEVGVISGTEAPPLFFRRVVVLPTTLTVAGSFESDKGVLTALAEGNSLDALRSIPVLSWISLQAIPLPIPFMRIEDCSSVAALLQHIVEDSNCVSIRFLLTACCCGLQPLSAVARVGEAAKGLLLLPLTNYRGAALHHAIRTASSVFMEELLAQTSGMAALLASGSYHASRALLDVLVAPQHRPLTITEPSRAAQPSGVTDGWRQGQEQLRVGLQEALTMASYCTGPDGSLLRVPAAALRLLMGVSGAATTTLWGVRNSQSSTVRERDGYIYKKK